MNNNTLVAGASFPSLLTAAGELMALGALTHSSIQAGVGRTGVSCSTEGKQKILL